jgi:beta-glucosidase
MLPYDHGVLAAIQQLTPGNVTNNGYKPQWPFGHGLSYTNFEYGDLALSGKTLKHGETLEVTVEVRNSGQSGGHHAVDLYVSDLYASISPAARKLRGFEKIYLEAGQSTTVTFKLDGDDLSFVNAALERVTEPGEFRVQVGDLTATFEYQ